MDRHRPPSIFNCFICSQPFSSRQPLGKGAKLPLVLHCGHSACNVCVARLMNKPGDVLSCQLCNTVSQASETYNPNKPELDFPFNTVILGQIAMKSQTGWDDKKISFTLSKMSLSPRQVLCHECVERKADFNCFQCQVPYCSSCFMRVHQSAKAFKDHTRTDLTSVESANIETKCPVHKGITNQFWCEQCIMALCSNCLISSHNGHPISLLCDKNLNCFKDLINSHVTVSNIQARLKATRKKTASSLSRLENQEAKGAEKEIREHFSRLHGLLTARENKLLSLLYSPFRGSANTMKNMVQQIDTSIEELNSHLQVSSALIQNEMKYLNCVSYYDVLQNLQKRESTPCFLLVSSESQDSSRFIAQDSIYETLESHGELEISSDTPMYKMVTEEELPTDFPIDPIKLITIDSFKGNVSSALSLALTEPTASGSSPSPSVSTVSLNSTLFADVGSSPNNGAHSADTSFCEYGNKNFDDLVEGCKVQVILTHAASPSDFYVRRMGLEKKLMEINHTFSKLSLKTPSKDRIKPGDYYMAQFSQDGRWYRSIATNVEPGNLITVFYIDFGNTENIKRENLRLMPQSLMKYDGMAVHCCLNDCIPLEDDWSPQAISTMLKIIESGDLSVVICSRSSGLLSVDLMKSESMDTVDLKKALMFLGYARSPDPMSSKILADSVGNQRQLPACKVLPNEQLMEVVLTHCESPYEFYVQDLMNVSTVKYLTKGLHDVYRKKSERLLVHHPKLGMIVAAMNGNDNTWRRAKIIALPDYKKVEVKYLDFGDSEVISFKRIRYLGNKFFKIGVQCSRCRLMDVGPLGGGEVWSDVSVERFASLVQQQTKIGVVYPESTNIKLKLIVYGRCDDSLLSVLYKDEGSTSLCINALIVMENFALGTGSNSEVLELQSERKKSITRQFMRSSVSSDSESEIKVDPHTAQIREKLLTQMTQLDSPPILYRTKTTASPQQKTSDEHRDNSKVSLTNRPLEPAQQDVSSSAGSLTSGGALQPNTADCIKLPVHIIKVVSPSEFYITPVSLVQKLKSLKNEMQKYYNSKEHCIKLKKIAEGSVCVIRRQVQCDWCRAIVVKVFDSIVEVRLPDFGEDLQVSKDDLLVMNVSFQELRDGATRCHLGGLKQPLDNRWPMTSTDEIIEFADKYDGKIYITKLGQEKANSLSVEVLMKEEVAAGALDPTVVTWTSLNNNLRMRGLALSDGTIDWDIEDYKFISIQKQLPRLQMDIFKGIPIKCVNITDNSQVDELQVLSNSESTFGSTVELNEDEEDPTSRRSTMDSLHSAIDDTVLSYEQCAPEMTPLPPAPSPSLPAPVMPKAWLPPLPFSKLDFIANPTNVNNDGSIFLQDFQKSISTLKKISEILDTHCRVSLPMAHDMYWSVDQTCIVRYHLDKKWYRGVVKSIKEDNTTMVELVDYGNVEECSVTDLRKVPLATEFPIQGQFCKLDQIKPNTGDGKWTIPVLDEIHRLVVEKHCLVKLLLDDSNKSYSVESIKLPNGSEMLAYLVKKGLASYSNATFSKRPLPSTSDSVLVSSVETDVILNRSCTAVQTVKSESQEEDITCQVISSLDISNYSTPNLPPDSQNGKTGDVKIPQSWVAECEAFMDAVEPNGAKLAKLEALHEEEADTINYLYATIPEDVQRFEVEVGALFGDTITFQIVHSDDLKLNHSRERFLELTEQLQIEAPQQPPIQLPKPNDACCAQFSEDGLWYRAQILEVPDEQHVLIKYVDYGNIERVPTTQVRELKELWTMIEVQSFEAKLRNIIVPELKCSWNMIKYELGEALLERKLSAVVFERKPMLIVELYDGDKLAYQNLLDMELLSLAKSKKWDQKSSIIQ